MANKNNGLGSAIGGIIVLSFLFGWLTIPSAKEEINEFQIASLTFANAIFIGWADNIAVELLYPENIYGQKEAANNAFRNAILLGEQEYPLSTALCNIFGAFISIGGVIAIWVSRAASSAKSAFNLGFWAEILESVAFHIGYYTTVGINAVSTIEVGITFIVALIMGFVARGVNKRHRRA